MLKNKAESLDEDGLFYVFVDLNGEGEAPSYHVVPSAVVAGHCGEPIGSGYRSPEGVVESGRIHRCASSSMRDVNGLIGGVSRTWILWATISSGPCWSMLVQADSSIPG